MSMARDVSCYAEKMRRDRHGFFLRHVYALILYSGIVLTDIFLICYTGLRISFQAESLISYTKLQNIN